MRINHNIAALNTYRQLGNANAAQQNSMEKLSSGLRINSAKDDAAGLAISEKMRGQIRGLDQASANAQDGISMIQTAEGALSETTDILQRMRELATQAANDTNTDTDRGEIQKEINQLTSEINRIGNTTEFNTQSLLKGATPGVTEATNYGDTELSNLKIASDSTLAAGNYTIEVADGASISTPLTGDGSVSSVNVASDSALDGDYKITTTFDGSTDTLSGQSTGITAVAYNGANNTDIADGYKIEFTYGAGDTSSITLKRADDTVVGTQDNIANDAGTVTIGDFEITLAADLDDTDGLGATATDANGTFNVSGNGWEATLTEADGTGVAGSSAVAIDPGDTEVDLGNGVTANFASSLTDSDEDTFSVGQGKVATLKDSEDNVVATTGLTNDTEDIAIGTTGLTIDAGTVADGTVSLEVTGGDFSSNFQIGANAGQSMTIEIGDMRATSDSLKIASEDGITVQSDSGKTAYYTEATDVTNGTDNEGTFKALDVSSHANASAAIDVINDAIEAVSGERSKLGAYQNRLDHTINNLGTSSENLTAAESRIRDVDYALAA